jgi:hypothetical protein
MKNRFETKRLHSSFFLFLSAFYKISHQKVYEHTRHKVRIWNRSKPPEVIDMSTCVDKVWHTVLQRSKRGQKSEVLVACAVEPDFAGQFEQFSFTHIINSLNCKLKTYWLGWNDYIAWLLWALQKIAKTYKNSSLAITETCCAPQNALAMLSLR